MVAGVENANVEALASLPRSRLFELRETLRIAGLDGPFLGKLARVGERLDEPMRAPMRAWNARRMPMAAAVLARLFVLRDPVSRDEAARALGDFAPWVAAGLLDETSRGVTSRARLAFMGERVVFGDPMAQGDGVPPLNGVTLLLARAALSRQRIETALDLGCGAGALALAFAGVARRVVATDVNPRAVAWTRFNAALNAVDNVEVRRSDLFDGVEGERFERIVSQPPFVARRPGAPLATFAHGGDRGDELALRLLEKAAAHLAPGGRAIVLADWPLVGDDAIDERVRRSVGDAPVSRIVMTSPGKNLDEYCTSLAASEHPQLDDAFAAAACDARDHFERLGFRSVAQALVVLEAGGPVGGVLVPVRHAHDAPVTADDIDRIVRGHRLLAIADPGGLLGARLRFPAGTRLVDQPLGHGAPASVIVQLPANRPEWPVVVQAAAAAILRAIDQAPTVLDAARASAGRDGAPLERAVAAFDITARDGLLRGALELAV
jgi:precorrin-6B methylase 2